MKMMESRSHAVFTLLAHRIASNEPKIRMITPIFIAMNKATSPPSNDIRNCPMGLSSLLYRISCNLMDQ